MYLINEVDSNLYHRIFKRLSLTAIDSVDEVETALHFEECKLTFLGAESPSA